MPRSKPSVIFPGSKGAPINWRPTKIMNVHDLSNDDDFLTHLLVEKLGTSSAPLYVHKMNPASKPIKVDPEGTMAIVRRLVTKKVHLKLAIDQAVDELLTLNSVRFYLQNKTQKQINAFCTHASRYLELYQPSGCIEIAHTSRYSHRTGKSELCILATRPLPANVVITELKGSMANLTAEEDKELKRTGERTDLRHSDIRRDFSVIHSKQMKKNHLFLGPARFVNHDCRHNCELFREGRYITFRTLRPIAVGEEITTHYGHGYFGRKNKNCLCKTCEESGRGGFAVDHVSDDEGGSSSVCDSDSDASASESSDSSEEEEEAGHLNERRTRRGVYAILQESSDSSDDSDDEGDANSRTAVDSQSASTPLAVSRASSSVAPGVGLMTPEPDSVSLPLSRASTLTSLSSVGSPSKSSQSATFRSIISTRRQKAREAALSSSPEKFLHSETPPAPDELPRSSSRLSGKQKASTPCSGKIDKGKVKDVGKVKKEDADSRTSRARSSVALTEEVVSSPKPDVLRGEDGKPLPICSTCSNILPVMCVDDKVVWGLDVSHRKKAKTDCPRCMRHFHIYQQSWPHRTVPRSAHVLPTPREDSAPMDSAIKRITPKVLPVLDKKLAGEKHRQERETGGETSGKRRKTENAAVKVTMSSKAKKELLDTTTKKNLARKGGRPNNPPDIPRKRGRPRLSSPRSQMSKRPSVTVEVKNELRPTPKLESSGSAFDQPREPNGRFGRKNATDTAKTPVKETKQLTAPSPTSRAQRAVERTRVKSLLEQEAEHSRKHAIESDDETEQGLPSPKRQQLALADAEADHRDVDEQMLPMRRSSSSMFRGGLLSRPAPYAMARRFLRNPSEDESSTDDNGPCTPDDHLSPPAVEIASELDPDVAPRPNVIAAPPSLGAFKPSPFMFAKRRWASASTPPVDDQEMGSSSSFKLASDTERVPSGGQADQRSISTFGAIFAPRLNSPLSSISSLSSCDSYDETQGNSQSGMHASTQSGRGLFVHGDGFRRMLLSPNRQVRAPGNRLGVYDQQDISDLESLSSLSSCSSPVLSRSTTAWRPSLLADQTSSAPPTAHKPIREDYSDVSSDEYEHAAPILSASLSACTPEAVSMQKPLRFTSDIVSTRPNFVNAGWESSSDDSE